MTYKVGPKGQVVLPKAIRDKLEINPGDKVIVEEQDGHVEIRKAQSKTALLNSLQGRFAGGPDMLADLEREHREEIEREERKFGKLAT